MKENNETKLVVYTILLLYTQFPNKFIFVLVCVWLFTNHMGNCTMVDSQNSVVFGLTP